jgi:A/G-specific adenine glycosylase
MLQQTQVNRVTDAYGRFINTFPTPKACADAGSAAVLMAWAGLGYNRRALNLHRAAVMVVDRFDGALPEKIDELRQLPGVGAYTARAVASFAFGTDTGVVDTNVSRLLSRAVMGQPLTMGQAQGLADDLVPKGRSSAFNQMLFDLGAALCLSSRPLCLTCPLRNNCTWHQAGNPEPDPARLSAGTGRRQSRFSGSDREGRGRLIAALRLGPLGPDEVARAVGWTDEPTRVDRVVGDLVAEHMVDRSPNGTLQLPQP